MKGQSSIEYLSTYGWMLLIVAIAATTVFTVAGDQCIPQANFNTEKLVVDDFAVNNESQLLLQLENRGTKTVELHNFTIKSSDDNITETINTEIKRGETQNLEFSPVFTTTETCNNFQTSLTYDGEKLKQLNLVGGITGKFDILEAPTSPQIEDVQK